MLRRHCLPRGDYPNVVKTYSNKVVLQYSYIQQTCMHDYFYCCTVHFDNVKIPFYQQMQLLLNIKNDKIYIKISYIRS